MMGADESHIQLTQTLAYLLPLEILSLAAARAEGRLLKRQYVPQY